MPTFSIKRISCNDYRRGNCVRFREGVDGRWDVGSWRGVVAGGDPQGRKSEAMREARLTPRDATSCVRLCVRPTSSPHSSFPKCLLHLPTTHFIAFLISFCQRTCALPFEIKITIRSVFLKQKKMFLRKVVCSISALIAQCGSMNIVYHSLQEGSLGGG